MYNPKLYVISGTSGKYAHTSYGMNTYPSEISRSFDGLVSTKEQHDISYDVYQPLVDLNIECLKRQDNWWAGNYQGDCKNCGIFTSTCDLPTFNITKLVNIGLFDAIKNWIKTGQFSFETTKIADIMETINAAAYPDIANDRYYPSSNPKPDCLDYYKIYSHKYSHGWIRYNELAVFCIRSFIE